MVETLEFQEGVERTKYAAMTGELWHLRKGMGGMGSVCKEVDIRQGFYGGGGTVFQTGAEFMSDYIIVTDFASVSQ